jgi:uncharacterized protein (DUF2141 family)
MNTEHPARSTCTRAASDIVCSKILRPAAWLVTAFLTIFANSLSAQDTTSLEAATNGSVEVTIEGIASTDGLIYVSLFSSANGFPGERELATASRSVPASDSSNGTLVLKFFEIPAGTFAISIMHDANANGKLDTNFMGIPSEDYGFSQNPNAMFGPPSFDEVTLSLAAGETQQLTIKLK